MKKVVVSKYVEKLFETPADMSCWCGYYNYDPLDADARLLLCGKAGEDGCAPRRGQTIELGLFDLSTGDWRRIGETDSWNWQQGAMQQWVDGTRKVVYNSSAGNHLVSVIRDTDTGAEKQVRWPVYGLLPGGGASLSLDLERSYWCRAYHYQSVVNEEADGPVLESDGIFLTDLEHNTRRRIVSIQDVIATDWRPSFDSCKHWLEHIMISPSGRRFCFLHRYSSAENVYSYKTRLFIADADGSGLKIVPGWDGVDWSHFGWRGDDGFAIYSYRGYRRPVAGDLGSLLRSPLKLMLKLYNAATWRWLPYSVSRALNGKRQYYQLYSVGENNEAVPLGAIESSMFRIDGHPSFTADGRYMITDSYPDRKGFQKLIVYDTVSGKSLLLAKLFAGLRDTPASCDLHPKLSRDNSRVCVDTAYDGRHHVIVFKLNWDLISEKLKQRG